MRDRKRLIPSLFICTVTMLAVWGIDTVGLFTPLNNSLYDSAVRRVRLQKSASDEVAVVLIDEASLRAMNSFAGRWPWPRAVYAGLFEFFRLAKPKMVLLDILFTETQGASGGALDPNDEAFVRATAEAGFVCNAAQLLRDTEDEQNKSLLNKPLPADFVTRFALKNADVKAPPPSLNNNFYIPFRQLYEAGKCVGIVEFSPDADGVYRRTKPFREYRGSLFPVLGIAPFTNGLPVTIDGTKLEIGPRRIVTDSQGNYILNVYGKYNTYSISGIFSSYRKIISGDVENIMVDPAEFTGKIVYIGASAVGVEDLKATAVSARTPGVYLHATLASNFILNDFLVPAGKGRTFAAALILAIITIAGTMLPKRPSLKLIAPFVACIVWGAFYLYRFQHNHVYDGAPPFAAILFSTLSVLGWLFVTEGREKIKVRKVFSQYVSPEVLEIVLDDFEGMGTKLSGAKEDITVLFADIRGFTSFSDRESPETVVKMLNSYLSRLTDVIFEGKGTVDKYIGDAIMAFWGAPIRIDNHPLRAVETACKMIRELDEVNREIREMGIDYKIRIGIGINSGPAVLGNIGSARKLSYTVIGDTVNLASRLESLNKNFGTSILISENTFRRLEGGVPCRIIDKVTVRGKKEDVRIFEVCPAFGDKSREHQFWNAETSGKAFECYERGDYNGALEFYRRIDDDMVKDIFLKRCENRLSASGVSERATNRND
ncbi:MAG: adenylate/guanylate cyclase domain-containing protein [Nitrospirae bacterium]|nr:adenylate/guanylate cyclase domain-containing protein [Nitrospirota bacterium]